MQAGSGRKLIRMLVGRILDEVFPNETPAARLQQVGLFTLIYMLQDDREPVTAARLSAMTGLADAQVIRHLRKLMKVGLVERVRILNKQGRGRAFHLAIRAGAQSRRLTRAIESASAKKKR
jgi:predicted ArsR family transcriptional regulator